MSIPQWTKGNCARCGQPHDLQAKLDKAVEALEWYQEKAEGCRKVTSEGDAARQALDADYGRKAKAVLGAIKGAKA